MRSFVRFDAVVATDRNQALMAVADALGASGGWIEDHTLFSDVMAVVRFSLPGDRLGDLGRALAAAGLVLDPPVASVAAVSGAELSGQLTLTFSRGTGDLRRAVPAFS
ncbi:hypothetical protein [Azospirillum agricola]|uniref:hypothetical protein n=1 Tax=Azospirillum agricola TaxID=1720247 RepID=UPI000A0F2EE9|nr:hypothetical protein [Azospirillum agricola]SMH52626.1 hypothetical protein SAMN02982994_3173 [Azospirillum lipoferum]